MRVNNKLPHPRKKEREIFEIFFILFHLLSHYKSRAKTTSVLRSFSVCKKPHKRRLIFIRRRKEFPLSWDKILILDLIVLWLIIFHYNVFFLYYSMDSWMVYVQNCVSICKKPRSDWIKSRYLEDFRLHSLTDDQSFDID